MGVTSLIPLLMSVALLSRTALDMTRSVTNRRGEDKGDKEDRDSTHRHSLASWGEKIEQERDFSDHQVFGKVGMPVTSFSYAFRDGFNKLSTVN